MKTVNINEKIKNVSKKKSLNKNIQTVLKYIIQADLGRTGHELRNMIRNISKNLQLTSENKTYN